jgi:BASS family bile acid:Na+ symporter
MLQRLLLVWLLLISALAYVLPQHRPGDALQTGGRGPAAVNPFVRATDEGASMQPRVPLGRLVMVTMFAVGALLTREELSGVIRGWPTVLFGTAVQYTAMPGLAYLLATLMQLPRDQFIGVVIVGCVPGAMASNVLTLMARGNVSYSVSLTTMATLISPLVVPVGLLVTLRTQATVDTSAIARQLLLEVVGPVILGHLAVRSAGPASQVIRRLAGPTANLAILWIIATVVALNRDRLQHVEETTVGVLLLLNVLGYAAGYLAGAAVRMSEPMCRALTIEIGMQNAGLGTSLALSLFPDTPTAAIPTAAYTFGCMLTGTMLAQWFSRRDAPLAAAAVAPPHGGVE